MAITPIDPATIEVGDPITADLFNTIKNNFDSIDADLNSLLLGAVKVSVFHYDMVNGSSFSTVTGLDYFQAITPFTLTNASIRIFEKGALTGEIEIDIKKSTTNMDNASFTSVFSVKPKITYSTAVDYQTSSNQVFNSSMIQINAGDILRLDITAAPNAALPRLKFLVYGEL
jgi:hypothetical protein